MEYDDGDRAAFMTRAFIQGICVLAIALGAGLFGFGSYARPDATNMVIMQQFNRVEDTHLMSAATTGAGIGFMTLGSLGLAVPWINFLVSRSRAAGAHEPVAGQISASA
jgi:hypothetical protein